MNSNDRGLAANTKHKPEKQNSSIAIPILLAIGFGPLGLLRTSVIGGYIMLIIFLGATYIPDTIVTRTLPLRSAIMISTCCLSVLWALLEKSM